jgi:RNA polymerase sigma-70 factor (ECF subfamily)
MPERVEGLAGIAALTQRLAAGDESAFREFHALYFDRLYQFLLVVARGQEHEAREALQETLLRVARHAQPFAEEEAFWCWLKAVARNAARDAGRKRTRYTALLQRFASLLRPQSAPAPAAEDDRLTTLLADCLAEFPVEDRALLEGKYLHGATVAELANQTNLSIKAIESRLVRLRRELRERALHKLRQP